MGSCVSNRCFAHAGEAYLPGPCSQDYKAYLSSTDTAAKDTTAASNKTLFLSPSGKCLIQGPIAVSDGVNLPKVDRITLRAGQGVNMNIQPAVIEVRVERGSIPEIVFLIPLCARG